MLASWLIVEVRSTDAPLLNDCLVLVDNHGEYHAHSHYAVTYSHRKYALIYVKNLDIEY